MKRIIPFAGLVILLIVSSLNLKAQECSVASGPGICTPQSGLTTVGFYPPDTSLPCVVDGQAYNQVISFLAPDSVESYLLDDIQITSLTNLPCGLCWALNNSSNEIMGNSAGCILVKGISNDARGEYKIKIYAKVTVQYPILPGLYEPITIGPLNIDSVEDFGYYARVKMPGDTCVQIDTNSVGNTASDSGSIVTPTILGTTTICAGDSTTLTVSSGSYYGYAWSNNTFNSSLTVSTAGTYTVTVYGDCNSASASASVVISTVSPPTITPGGATTFCQGGSVSLTSSAGSTYHWSTGASTQAISAAQTGSYTVTITNANNCSASSTATAVTVNSNPSATVTAGGPTTFCQGDSVSLSAPAGLTYAWSTTATTQSINVSTTGSYKVTVTNTNNCSAISSPTAVTVNSNPSATITPGGSTTFCDGGSVSLSAPAGFSSYLWSTTATTQSIDVTETGSFSVDVTDANGCTAASSPTAVTVNSNPSASITAGGPTTFCPGDSVILTANSETGYAWTGGATTQSITASTSGNYSVTVTDDNGCTGASTPTSVSLYPVTQITGQPQDESTCAGGNASFTVAATGNNLSYQWLVNGSLNGVVSATDTIAAAADVDTGYYAAIVTGTCGVDTSNAAHLSISNTVNILQQPASQVTCSGTTVTFTVSVNGSSLGYQWYKGSQLLGDQTSSTLSLNNVSSTDAGSYYVAISSSCGDTASETATLTVNSADTTILIDTICSNESVIFNGQTLNTSGTYMDTLSNGSGCDSLVILSLTVNSVSQSFFSPSICAGDVYDFEGQILTEAGTYYDTLTNATGCDSIITLQLTVNQPSATTINAAICSGSSYSFGGQSLSEGGTYYDTLQNVLGCDSIITLNLQVNSVITTNLSQGICQGDTFVFNGAYLTSSGVYKDTLQASGGCDSVIALTLTVNPTSQSSVTDSICAGSSFNFNGTVLDTAGVYVDTLSSTSGCDSIVTLTLTVIQPTVVTLGVTVCNGSSYFFNGQQLNEAGTYYDTLTGSNGCDSIIVLNLQLSSFLTTNISASICDGSTYIFDTTTLSTGGIYYDTLQASGGCDSIVILNLSVNQPVSRQITGIICAGSTYPFGAQNISTAGIYIDTLTGINGCDSIVTLQLTVTPPPTTTQSAVICSGQNYPFGGQTLTAKGTYTDTLTTEAGCDSIVVLTLTVDTPATVQWNVSDTLCNDQTHIIVLPSGTPAGGTFSGTGVTRNVLNLADAGSSPYTVTYTYIDSNGCGDSTSKAFVVENCTGIDQVSLENSLSLYPNPVGSQLTAESSYFTIGVKPIIFDVSGREMNVNYTLQGAKLVFDTKQLPAGVYCIRFVVGNAATSQRFVKAE